MMNFSVQMTQPLSLTRVIAERVQAKRPRPQNYYVELRKLTSSQRKEQKREEVLQHVVQLLEEGADVNEEDDKLGNPLLAAVWSQNMDIITLSVKNKADWDNMGSVCGMTPLIVAILLRDVETVRFLLAQGVNFNLLIIKDIKIKPSKKW